jgi:hypothetical protein
MIHQYNIECNDEYIQLRNELIKALDKISMAKCKIPHRIKQNYLDISKVKNFGRGFRRHHGYGDYKANRKHPKVYELLQQFIFYIHPELEYQVITINRDVCMLKHKDCHNETPSIFICLGDYIGGGLIVYDENDNPSLYDCKDKIIEFNGSKYAHETEDFIGRRYSIIIYSSRKPKRLYN